MIIRRKLCPHVVPPVIFDSNVMSDVCPLDFCAAPRSYDGNDENGDKVCLDCYLGENSLAYNTYAGKR